MEGSILIHAQNLHSNKQGLISVHISKIISNCAQSQGASLSVTVTCQVAFRMQIQCFGTLECRAGLPNCFMGSEVAFNLVMVINFNRYTLNKTQFSTIQIMFPYCQFHRRQQRTCLYLTLHCITEFGKIIGPFFMTTVVPRLSNTFVVKQISP